MLTGFPVQARTTELPFYEEKDGDRGNSTDTRAPLLATRYPVPHTCQDISLDVQSMLRCWFSGWRLVFARGRHHVQET